MILEIFPVCRLNMSYKSVILTITVIDKYKTFSILNIEVSIFVILIWITLLIFFNEIFIVSFLPCVLGVEPRTSAHAKEVLCHCGHSDTCRVLRISHCVEVAFSLFKNVFSCVPL